MAEELNNRRRLSIDVLQRWGTDLLTALVALERNGVNHRDIKRRIWLSSNPTRGPTLTW